MDQGWYTSDVVRVEAAECLKDNAIATLGEVKNAAEAEAMDFKLRLESALALNPENNGQSEVIVDLRLKNAAEKEENSVLREQLQRGGA